MTDTSVDGVPRSRLRNRVRPRLFLRVYSWLVLTRPKVDGILTTTTSKPVHVARRFTTICCTLADPGVVDLSFRSLDVHGNTGVDLSVRHTGLPENRIKRH